MESSKIEKDKRSSQSTGLSESAINIIQAVFEQYPQIESVILYGSRANGNYRKGSDIDLTIKLKPGYAPDLNLYHRIASQLDDLGLIYKIDLSFYQQIENPDLIEHIDRVGIGIYPYGRDSVPPDHWGATAQRKAWSFPGGAKKTVSSS